MKFEISREWLESVSLEEDASDCSAGILKYDLASYVENSSTEPTSPAFAPKRRTTRRRKTATTTATSAALTTPLPQ